MLPDAHLKRMLSKLRRFEETLAPYLFTRQEELSAVACQTGTQYYGVPKDLAYQPIHKGTPWGGTKQYLWVKAQYTVPEHLDGKDLFLMPRMGGYEAMLYVNGEPYGTFNTKIVYTGHGNHYCDLVRKGARAGETIDLAVEYYSGHAYQGCNPFAVQDQDFHYTYEGMYLCTKNDWLLSYWFDLKTVNQLALHLPENSFFRARVLNALTKVSLPDSLESITTQTFCQCPLLVELTIPEYVFSISGGMISQCPITTLTIPAYVNFIASAPCSECNDLEAFIVDKDNAYFRADDGVLTDAEKTRIIQFPSGKSGSYTFPESVHTIEKFAFHNSSKLEGVTFSDKIEEIPMGCFSFSGLKKVEIPESVTYIGVNAFLCCEQLESVTLTDGLRGIDTAGFYQCTSLKEITVPDSVTEIGMYALSYADVNDEISTYPLTVKGSKNSAAEKYANDNSLIFQATN